MEARSALVDVTFIEQVQTLGRSSLFLGEGSAQKLREELSALSRLRVHEVFCGR